MMTRLLTGGAQVFLLTQWSRALEVEGLGKLLFYLAFFVLLESMADLGLSQTTLAKAGTAPERTGEWIHRARIARWRIAVPACLVVPAVALWLGDSPWIPSLLGGAELFLLPLGLGGIAFQRRLDYLPLSLARLGGAGFSVLLALLLLASGIRDWEWHLASVSAGTMLTNLWLCWLARREKIQAGVAVESPSLLSQAWPLGASNAAQQAYFGAGGFFVRQNCPTERFWEFGIPFRAYTFALMIPQYLTGASIPLLAEKAARDRPGYRALRRRILLGLLALGVPTTAVVLIWGPQLLAVVFGPGKEAAASSLKWLALSGLFVVFGTVGTTCLVARGQSRTLLGLSAITAAITLPLSWGLTRSGEPVGAAMGCAIAEGLVAASSWALLLHAERGEP